MRKPLLTTNAINYKIGTRELFKDLSLSINDGDRAVLIGTNGSGKSTLMRMLYGDIQPDDGSIIKRNGLQIGYVEQFLPKEHKWESALDLVLAMLPEAEQIYQSYKAEMLLEDLGIGREKFGLSANKLSGGQINLIMLARAIIKEPDLLFLDEPTNHLDLESLIIIENFLHHQYKKSFLLISHDADFLDNVGKKTLFIQNAQVYSFQLSYRDAKEEMKKLGEELTKKLKIETKEINRLEASAKRLASWGKIYDNEDLSKKARSMKKKIEKLTEQKTEVFTAPQYKLKLDLESSKNKIMFRAENYDVIIPHTTKKLYNIKRFYINKGDRIILLGPNGSGKTTFIKQMVSFYQSEDHEKQLYFNPQVKLGYYDQEQELLNNSNTIFEEVRDKVDSSNDEIKRELIYAGFAFDELDKSIAVLSGGERARILFLILKLNKPNLIILDEPTNHIDLYGREELMNDLMNTGATILVTTHDRNFSRLIGLRYILIKENELIEIYDPEEFYTKPQANVNIIDIDTNVADIKEAMVENDDDEVMVNELIELEEKLQHNLQQKKSHQKPELQEKWRKRIAVLYKKLSL